MMRTNGYRLDMLNAAVRCGRGHLGGAFSCVDILVAIKHVMQPNDRLILSKGHAGIALYAVFHPEGLEKFCLDGSMYAEHPSIYTPGVEVTTGSLGHGLGIACGMAMARKLDSVEGTIYVVLGDGECMEGSVYEALVFANIHKLDNLCIIVDRNMVMSTANIPLSHSFLSDVMRSIGCKVFDADGHNIHELQNLMDAYWPERVPVIVAKTIKGKGVSFMEGKHEWHNGVPKGEQLELARKELADA